MPSFRKNSRFASPAGADPFPVRPSSLLFIKPGSMGDVIHALPVASSIHNAWPGTKITWIVDPRWEPLLRGNPAINRIHLFPRERFRGAGGFLRSISWYRSLRKLQPEMALDLQCLLRSGVMASCSGAKTVFGLDDAREGAGFFYTNKIRVRRDEHAVRRYLRSVPSLGIEPRRRGSGYSPPENHAVPFRRRPPTSCFIPFRAVPESRWTLLQFANL